MAENLPNTQQQGNPGKKQKVSPQPGDTSTLNSGNTQPPSPSSIQPPSPSNTQPYPGSTPDGTDTPKPPKGQGWTDEEKRALKAKITDQAAVLTFCLKTAKEQFGDYCRTEESLINLAIALYTGTAKPN